ncbi:MAG: hypothetical protein AB1546_15325 [bacterium]
MLLVKIQFSNPVGNIVYLRTISESCLRASQGRREIDSPRSTENAPKCQAALKIDPDPALKNDPPIRVYR